MIGAMSIRKKRQLQETQVRFFLVILLAILFSSLHNPLDLFSFTSSVFRYYISYILIEVLSDKLIWLVKSFANVAFGLEKLYLRKLYLQKLYLRKLYLRKLYLRKSHLQKVIPLKVVPSESCTFESYTFRSYIFSECITSLSQLSFPRSARHRLSKLAP